MPRKVATIWHDKHQELLSGHIIKHSQHLEYAESPSLLNLSLLFPTPGI